MNIYFSASIKGGRQLVNVYHEIIEYLKEFGNVLTEHIGDPMYASNGFRPQQQVYLEDRALMDKSDVVVAEVSTPSLGVGYELAYCEARKIPVLCLYQGTVQKVSSMISGNKYFVCVGYDNIEQAKQIAKEFLTNIQKNNRRK